MYAISKGGILLLTYEKDDNAKSGTLDGIFGRFGTLLAVGEVIHA